jgi:cell division protein FtsN
MFTKEPNQPEPLTEPPALEAVAEKPLPKPEDFSDPQVAEAVRAMLEALNITGWRR